jgi:hypothetical protein
MTLGAVIRENRPNIAIEIDRFRISAPGGIGEHSEKEQQGKQVASHRSGGKWKATGRRGRLTE